MMAVRLMQPTILVGDRIFVNKLAYDLKVPFTTGIWPSVESAARRHCGVFLAARRHRLVKRVVGLPGDTVELRNEQLIINGSPVDYTPLNAELSDQLPKAERPGSEFATEKLPGHDHVVMALPSLPAKRTLDRLRCPPLLLHDGRQSDNSFDSRYFGTVDRQRIVAKRRPSCCRSTG